MTYKQQQCISYSCGGWKPEIRLPVCSGFGESPLLSTECCLLVVSSHLQQAEQRSNLFHDSHKGTKDAGPTLMTSSHPNCLPKAPPPNIITWGRGESQHEFGGDTNIQSITASYQCIASLFQSHISLPILLEWRCTLQALLLQLT